MLSQLVCKTTQLTLETANADNDFRAGISYAVNDDMSISYNIAKTEYENTSLEDQEATGMSFSTLMVQ